MNITHGVHPIRQPNLNDCWATASAMVLRLPPATGVAQVQQRVRGHVTLNANGSISPGQVGALGRALHLAVSDVRTEPLATPLLSRVLRASCAAAFGNFNYPGAPRSQMHVLLIYRLTGRDANPLVTMVDPYTARRISYYVEEINEALGSVDYLLHQ